MLRAAARIRTASLAGHITRSAQAARRPPLHRLCSPQDCAQSEQRAVDGSKLFGFSAGRLLSLRGIGGFGIFPANGRAAASHDTLPRQRRVVDVRLRCSTWQSTANSAAAIWGRKSFGFVVNQKIHAGLSGPIIRASSANQPTVLQRSFNEFGDPTHARLSIVSSIQRCEASFGATADAVFSLCD